MSAHYKVAWLCEALLVSRSGYYDWKNRRSKPGPREVESIHLRERIREEFARSRQIIDTDSPQQQRWSMRRHERSVLRKTFRTVDSKL